MAGLERELSSCERFWRFRETPFPLTSDPHFLFASSAHTDAVAQFERMLERHEPILLITGEPGVGKTLLCRTLARRRDTRTVVGFVSTAPASREDLLRTILDSFGVLAPAGPGVSDAPRFELLKVLQQFLHTLDQLDARAVIVVDDAHVMPAEAFEELRELSDVDGRAGKMVQTVLVGEPALRERLASSSLQDFAQRVTRRATLGALTPSEVPAYIEHRLRMAFEAGEADQAPFTPKALDAIAAASGGVPRVINVICDRALERASSLDRRVVDEGDISAAARELGLAGPAAFGGHRRRAIAAAAAASILLAAMSGGIWFLSRRSAPPVPGSGPAMPAPGGAAVAPASADAVPASASSAAAERAEPAVEAPPPSEDGGTFSVVTDSFQSDVRAAVAARDVAQLGFPARVRLAGGWHQVIVGPYATREEAEAARERLRSTHNPESAIVRGRPPVAANEPTGGGSTPAPPATSPPPADIPAPPLGTDQEIRAKAEALSRVPDVRALLSLRDEVAGRPSSTSDAGRNELLQAIDGYLDAARRLQLEIDRQQLQPSAERG